MCQIEIFLSKLTRKKLNFLAHRIRIPDSLPRSKLCPTHVTLLGLLRECCTLVVLELTHIVVK